MSVRIFKVFLSDKYINSSMATASNDQSGGGGIGGGGAAGIGQRQKEIYKYEAPWPLYSMHWAVRPGEPGIGASSSSSRRGTFRLALGSFIEEYCNRVQIVTLDEATGEFAPMSTFEHNYPPTKILFIPDQVVFTISYHTLHTISYLV